MATKMLEEKVQKHDDEAKLASGAQSKTHGKAYEQVTSLICDSYARRILCQCAAAIWGGYLPHEEQNIPPKYTL